MEVYTIKKDKIVNLIEKNGGTLLKYEKDICAGPKLLGYLYCVKKLGR